MYKCYSRNPKNQSKLNIINDNGIFVTWKFHRLRSVADRRSSQIVSQLAQGPVLCQLINIFQRQICTHSTHTHSHKHPQIQKEQSTKVHVSITDSARSLCDRFGSLLEYIFCLWPMVWLASLGRRVRSGVRTVYYNCVGALIKGLWGKGCNGSS